MKRIDMIRDIKKGLSSDTQGIGIDSSAFEALSRLQTELDAKRIKSNIDSVKLALKRLHSLCDRANLLKAYQDIFEEEDAKDRNFTTLQFTNESNAIGNTLEFIVQQLDLLKPITSDKVYADLVKSYGLMTDQVVEIFDPDFKGTKSSAVKDPVLQYARDTNLYAASLLFDARSAVEHGLAELRTAEIYITQTPQLKRPDIVNPFVQTINQDFKRAISYAMHTVDELRVLEDVEKRMVKFDPRLHAAFTRP